MVQLKQQCQTALIGVQGVYKKVAPCWPDDFCAFNRMNNATTKNFTGGKKTLPEMGLGFFNGRKLSMCEKKKQRGANPPMFRLS